MRVVLVPGVLALLPDYASLEDPVPDLRATCLSAVAWLGGGARVLGDPRFGEALGVPAAGDGPHVLVVGNGTACRTERAPGFLDGRAAAYDDVLGAALAAGDTAALAALDLALGRTLLASLDGIAQLPGLLASGTQAEVTYDDDPFGVQYWVMRWETT